MFGSIGKVLGRCWEASRDEEVGVGKCVLGSVGRCKEL